MLATNAAPGWLGAVLRKTAELVAGDFQALARVAHSREPFEVATYHWPKPSNVNFKQSC